MSSAATATLATLPAGRVIACAQGASPAVVGEWSRRGVPFVEAGRLVHAVDALMARVRGRAPWAVGKWCPVAAAPGSAVFVALAAIPTLRRPFHVGEWHAALGWSRRRLRDVVTAALGVAPSRALWWCVEAPVRRLRAEGRSMAETECALGHHDAAALERAWQRRMRAPPPVGGRGAGAEEAALKRDGTAAQFWLSWLGLPFVQFVPFAVTPLALPAIRLDPGWQLIVAVEASLTRYPPFSTMAFRLRSTV